MNDEFKELIEELQSAKKIQTFGDSRSADMTQMAYTLKRKIKENFLINAVPIRIKEELDSFQERCELFEEYFELCIDIIINELKKNELKKNKSHNCSSSEYCCHFLGKKLTLTYQPYGHDSIHIPVQFCPFCGYKEEK